MKGIVLAGGTGSRLWPITITTSKQLLPVYDKPMIYYPLATLMLAGVKNILIITTPAEQQLYVDLLGDGSQLGIQISFATQAKPEGLAQALIIAEEFLEDSSFLMILGDNIFHGSGLGNELKEIIPTNGAHIFAYEVADPSQYGVLTLDSNFDPIEIREKPRDSKSKLAVTGLYFFDSEAISIAKSIHPSERGELEITSVLDVYLQKKLLTYTKLNRGVAWLDTGNPKSLHEASSYVQIIEDRTGLKVACIEEIALNCGYIQIDEFQELAKRYKNNSYGQYLSNIAKTYQENQIELKNKCFKA